MKAETIYRLTDNERKVIVVWPVNSTSAALYLNMRYLGELAVLMLANPTLEQFASYVEAVIDQVVGGYAKAVVENG